jgi:hypothetical protein
MNVKYGPPMIPFNQVSTPISFKGTVNQINKLRQGIKTRIKKGKGFTLLVHPNNYEIVSRAFTRNQGADISLSPAEMQINQEQTHLMEGKGIFGKKFDKVLDTFHLKKAAYKLGDKLKPAVKASLLASLATGGAALGASELMSGVAAPLIPLIPAGVAGLYSQASSYLDNPSGYKRPNVGGLASKYAKARANEMINEHLGTNHDYMNRAGLSQLANDATNQALNEQAFLQKSMAYNQPMEQFHQMPMYGYGIHRHHESREVSSIGRGSGFINSRSSFHPAMMSQPHGANLQMKHFLPPSLHSQFDPFLDHNHNNIIGTGLYI